MSALLNIPPLPHTVHATVILRLQSTLLLMLATAYQMIKSQFTNQMLKTILICFPDSWPLGWLQNVCEENIDLFRQDQ